MIKDDVTLQEGAYQGKLPFAKFGGHRPCVSGDILMSVCHVILEDRVIKGLCDFINRSPSR